MRSLQLFPWRSEPSASLWEKGVPLQYWCWQPGQSLEAAHHFGSLHYDRLIVQGQPLRDFFQTLLTADSVASFRGFLRFVQRGQPLEWPQWSGLQREETLFLPRAWWPEAAGWEAHRQLGKAVWGDGLRYDEAKLDGLRELTPVPSEECVRKWAKKMDLACADYSPEEVLPGRGLIWRKGERAHSLPEGRSEWELSDYQQLWAPRNLWPFFWNRGVRWAVVGNVTVFSPKQGGAEP